MISEAVGIRDEQAFSWLSRFMHTFNVLIDTDGDGELSETFKVHCQRPRNFFFNLVCSFTGSTHPGISGK